MYRSSRSVVLCLYLHQRFKGFKEVCYEHVLDTFLTALHKGHDYSLRHKHFCRFEYFSNVTLERCLPLSRLGC